MRTFPLIGRRVKTILLLGTALVLAPVPAGPQTTAQAPPEFEAVSIHMVIPTPPTTSCTASASSP